MKREIPFAGQLVSLTEVTKSMQHPSRGARRDWLKARAFSSAKGSNKDNDFRCYDAAATGTSECDNLTSFHSCPSAPGKMVHFRLRCNDTRENKSYKSWRLFRR